MIEILVNGWKFAGLLIFGTYFPFVVLIALYLIIRYIAGYKDRKKERKRKAERDLEHAIKMGVRNILEYEYEVKKKVYKSSGQV